MSIDSLVEKVNQLIASKESIRRELKDSYVLKVLDLWIIELKQIRDELWIIQWNECVKDEYKS